MKKNLSFQKCLACDLAQTLRKRRAKLRLTQSRDDSFLNHDLRNVTSPAMDLAPLEISLKHFWQREGMRKKKKEEEQIVSATRSRRAWSKRNCWKNSVLLMLYYFILHKLSVITLLFIQNHLTWCSHDVCCGQRERKERDREKEKRERQREKREIEERERRQREREIGHKYTVNTVSKLFRHCQERCKIDQIRALYSSTPWSQRGIRHW